MPLFLNLLLAHLLGDYVLQPGRLVLAKREGLRGQLLHAAVITVATALTLVGQLRVLWWVVPVVGIAHFSIEPLTIAARERLNARGLFLFAFDQSLHLLSIVVLAWLAGPSASWSPVTSFGLATTVPALAFVDGVVMVTFLGSILVFETARAALPPDPLDDGILHWSTDRVMGMAERGSALVLAVWVTPLAMLAPFLPRVVGAVRAAPRRRAIYLVEAATGLLLVLVTYVIVAAVAAA